MRSITSTTASTTLTLRGQSFQWGQRTILMGVLNITPDSFSDGGQFHTIDAAIAQAKYLAASGADIIDVGGQSTRPNAEDVSLEEELERVIPVITALRQDDSFNTPISIDTMKSVVAEAAVKAGADLVNDVSGALFDPAMLPMVAGLGVPIVLMHMRGSPQTMQQLTEYIDLIEEICEFLEQRAEVAMAAGIDRANIILDPGIGFAKNHTQNLDILRYLTRIRILGYPLLVGPSRKSFIGQILNQPDPQQRVWGTAAACCAAIANGADILRLHDIRELRDTCRIADAIWRSPTV